MIMYGVKLMMVCVFVLVGVVCCVSVFDGWKEVFGVCGLILSGMLFSLELWIVRMEEIENEIDEEYMSDEWLDRKKGEWESEREREDWSVWDRKSC
jgi:hypothetical protein